MISALLLALGYTLVLGACGGLVTVKLFPRWSTLLERMVVRCLLGTAVLPIVLIAAYELLGVRFRPITTLCVAVPGLCLLLMDERRRWRDRRAVRRLATREELLVALMSFGVLLSCYVGSVRYPMFEGRDPWGHLLGVRYLLETGELRQPFSDWPVLHYIDGYPPLYDLFLAVPASLSASLNLAAKASNSVIVGLVSLVMLLLVRRLSRSAAVAMTATVLLVVLPGSLTRQIWGHSLAVLLALTGLLCALRCRASKRWMTPAAVAFGGVLLAAPTQGIKAGLLLILTTIVALAMSRRWALRLLITGTLAVVLAMLWYLPLFLRTELSPRGLISSMDHPALRRTEVRWRKDPGSQKQGLRATLLGSGHSETNLDDFLFMRPLKLMRRWFPEKALGNVVPQGLGVAGTALAALFLLSLPGRWFRHRHRRLRPGWRELLAVWLLFTLVGVLGRYLGIGLYVWRFWMLLCPIACIAAAERAVSLARAWPHSLAARITLVAVTALAVTHALLCVTWMGEPLLWKFFGLNPPFLLVLATIVLWLALAHAGSRLGLRPPAFALIAVLVLAHVAVGTPVRLRALTAFVKPSIFLDPVEYAGYARMAEKTAPGALVFPLSDDDHCSAVVSLDRSCRPWLRAERLLREQMLVRHRPPDPEELVAWLQAQGYSYAIADPSFQRLLARWLGERRARRYLQTLLTHPAVHPVLSTSSDPPARPSSFHLLRIDRPGKQ